MLMPPAIATNAQEPPKPALQSLSAWLAIFGMLAVVVPALIVVRADPIEARNRPHLSARPVVPRTKMPSVEPLKFETLAQVDAVGFNAAIPFSSAPNPSAKPFRFASGTLDAARAIDCLASAVLYEAGDDSDGQRPVAQVVINRVRHPAFPKTICGVVFEGAERSTGCQFSFTCDGALIRHRFSDEAWLRAQSNARLALNGSVDRRVGLATHYHTNWVVPYWSASLDKITAVGTHLFFRWTGWWGTPPAFRAQIANLEPIVAQLSLLSEAHRARTLSVDAAFENAASDASSLDLLRLLNSTPASPRPEDDNTFIVTVASGLAPDRLATIAALNCDARPYCKFMAWVTKAKTPKKLPLEEADIAAMSFSFLRDRRNGFEKALWNCADFPRANHHQCMKARIPPAGSAEFEPILQYLTQGQRDPAKAEPRAIFPESKGADIRAAKTQPKGTAAASSQPQEIGAAPLKVP